MPTTKKLDPTGERAEATEAMESTPISGKEHEYKADGDHRPRQREEAIADGGKAKAKAKADAGGQAGAKVGVAPEVGVKTERHISEGIPGAGKSPSGNAMPDTKQRERNPRG